MARFIISTGFIIVFLMISLSSSAISSPNRAESEIQYENASKENRQDSFDQARRFNQYLEENRLENDSSGRRKDRTHESLRQDESPYQFSVHPRENP